MLANPACPICASEDWLPLGKHRYSRHRESAGKPIKQIREEILFDLWLQTVDKATLSTSACRRCGFVTYMPRPEHADIVAKYRHLETHSDTAAEYFRDLPSDLIRSQELYRSVRRLLPTHGANILDFGGGKGRLLYRFVESGHVCYVSDYVDHVIDGVRFLGPDLDAIAREYHFDLVICSHVIEHVADPVGMLHKLAATVGPKGYLYVEVPLELWRRVPPTIDPITHVNFFTKESLHSAIEAARYTVIDCRYESFVRPNGRIGMAIKSIARPSSTERPFILSGTSPVMTLIHPSLARRAWRLLRHPRLLLNRLNLEPDEKIPRGNDHHT